MPIGQRHAWTARGLMSLLLVICALALVWGCSTEKHYQTLAFFFDGVPKPGEPPRPRHRRMAQLAKTDTATPGQAKGLPVIAVHAPYKQGLCDSCHATEGGAMLDFNEVTSQVCLKCHAKQTNQFAMMHGPVAAAMCLQCHAPHDSVRLHLVRDEPRKLCGSCHAPELLGYGVPQHHLGEQSCLDCHQAHGGDKMPFLKPDWKNRMVPTTAPATAPAPLPTTAPAHAPVQRAALDGLRRSPA